MHVFAYVLKINSSEIVVTCVFGEP